MEKTKGKAQQNEREEKIVSKNRINRIQEAKKGKEGNKVSQQYKGFEIFPQNRRNYALSKTRSKKEGGIDKISKGKRN